MNYHESFSKGIFSSFFSIFRTKIAILAFWLRLEFSGGHLLVIILTYKPSMKLLSFFDPFKPPKTPSPSPFVSLSNLFRSEADRLEQRKKLRLAEQERRRQESARIDFMDSSIMMIEFEDQFKRQPSSIFWVKKMNEKIYRILSIYSLKQNRDH